MTENIRQSLINQARIYDNTGVGLDQFLADVGWQEWMEDYTDAKDWEEISVREEMVINTILEEIFDDAHHWYAVVSDDYDAWDYGSYDYDEAVRMVKRQGYGEIAVITTDDGGQPVCIDVIEHEDTV